MKRSFSRLPQLHRSWEGEEGEERGEGKEPDDWLRPQSPEEPPSLDCQKLTTTLALTPSSAKPR